MTIPRAPARLPGDMAQSLGHAIAAFGFLEEALKRAIFSLTRKGLGAKANERALESWLHRMEDIADDSLGTLIDAFIAALAHGAAADRKALTRELRDIRLMRNLLCHASWRPGGRDGHWRPTFINTRGEKFPDEMSVEDLDEIAARTLAAARRAVSIMRATGIDGEWIGWDDDEFEEDNKDQPSD